MADTNICHNCVDYFPDTRHCPICEADTRVVHGSFLKTDLSVCFSLCKECDYIYEDSVEYDEEFGVNDVPACANCQTDLQIEFICQHCQDITIATHRCILIDSLCFCYTSCLHCSWVDTEQSTICVFAIHPFLLGVILSQYFVGL
jgi:hypothetical protein